MKEKILIGIEREISILEDIQKDFLDSIKDKGTFDSLEKYKAVHESDCGIYIFYLSNTDFPYSEKEYNEIKKEIKKSKSVFLPRFNNQNLNIKIESKKCLYVGSSKKLLSRLAEHFTESHPKTYALHLSEWAKQIEQNITFQILEINKNDASDINNKMQKCEDILWDSLKPILGKLGKK